MTTRHKGCKVYNFSKKITVNVNHFRARQIFQEILFTFYFQMMDTSLLNLLREIRNQDTKIIYDICEIEKQ